MFMNPAGCDFRRPVFPASRGPSDFPFKTIYGARGARIRLICFPGAGNSASFYRFWRDFGGAAIRVDAYQPKGRNDRWHEGRPTLTDSVEEAAGAILTALRDGERLALFGHSFGALMAYEVAHALSLTHVRVDHLLVAARAAPHMAPHDSIAADLPDAALIEALRGIGLDDKDILSHPALGPQFLDNLRHDLRQNAGYVHWHDAQLDCPVTAFSGKRDPLASPLAMAAWQSCSTGPFFHHRMTGQHFFPRTGPVRLARLIKARLEALA